MFTGLELTFVGLTRSNTGLFSTPCFIVSPVRKRERRGKKKPREGKEGKREYKRKGKKEVMWKGGKKERKEKRRKKSYPGFKLVRLVLLVFLSVKQEGVVGRIGFTFLPS